MTTVTYTDPFGNAVAVNKADGNPADADDNLDRAQRIYPGVIELASPDAQTVWRLLVDDDGDLYAMKTVDAGQPVDYTTATKVQLNA